MAEDNSKNCDPRPIFDIRQIPLLDRFKSVGAMRMAMFKAAFPDLIIAGTFLYAITMFLEITPAFRSNMEGLTIIELIVLIVFPLMFRIFATEEKTEFRASSKLRFMTGWINIFNLFFILLIMVELAFLTSIAEGRKWIPLQLFILAAGKIYSVFFTGEQKVKPIAFVSKMTARLVGGLFCGIFTYFFAAIVFGLLLNPKMLSEMCMLLAGYVFFVMFGIYSLYKQDFLSFLGGPSNVQKHDTAQKMICEIWYPRIEVPITEFKVPEDANAEQATGNFKKTRKRSLAFPVLLISLLLPAICILPIRSKLIEHSKVNTTEIHKNKIAWEDRFNLGAGIVFGTCMLWIFFVIPMMMLREKNDSKKS